MDKRGAFFLILAFVLAVTTGGGIYLYLKGVAATQEEVEPETVPVIVASKDMNFGTKLTEEHLRIAQYPKDSIPSGAYSDLDSVLAQTSKVFMVEGEPVLRAKLSGIAFYLLIVPATWRLGRQLGLGHGLAALEEATSDMERALADGDLDAWAAADDRFHRKLLEMHGNRRLQAIVNSLLDQAHRARMLPLRLRDTPTRSTEEHREILRHIAAGDAEKTRACFFDHRIRTANELLGLLDKLRLSQV